MRFRVDTCYGYVSFDGMDRDKAFELYHQEGLRILLCDDLFDRGNVLEGLPLSVDYAKRGAA